MFNNQNSNLTDDELKVDLTVLLVPVIGKKKLKISDLHTLRAAIFFQSFFSVFDVLIIN